MQNEDSVLSVTCKLVDKLVNVCGDEWLECHGEEEVRRMKEMQLESFLIKNRELYLWILRNAALFNCTDLNSYYLKIPLHAQIIKQSDLKKLSKTALIPSQLQ